MSFDKKDTLKIGKGEIVTVKLDGNEPFKSGQNTFDGKVSNWHGYNIVKDGVEYTYFASDSVHYLIKEAEPRGDFTLELRTLNNKEGQPRSVWHLIGKSIYQYQDEKTNNQPQEQENQPQDGQDAKVPSIQTAPVADDTMKQKNVEDYINQAEMNLKNASDILKKIKDEYINKPVESDDIPF